MIWEQVRREFETTNITMKALAERHNIKPSTLRSRKNREDWQRNIKKDATQRNAEATKRTTNAMVENDELTDEQKLFCLYYLQYFNATKAYQEAFQVDYKSANASGARLLANVSIKSEIKRLKDELQSDVYLSVRDLISEYAKQAFADITDFVDFGHSTYTNEDGEENTYSFVALKDSDTVDGTLIHEVKQGRDGVSVKLYDKQKAMDVLMKYLGDNNDGENKQTVFLHPDEERRLMKEWKDSDV